MAADYLKIPNCIGKDRGWKVNMMSLEIWGRKIIDEAFNSSSAYGAVFGGLVANCWAKEEDQDFTYEQVCDWVDEINLTDEGEELLKQIRDMFEASQYYIRVLEKMKVQLNTQNAAVDEKKNEPSTA